MNDQLQELLDNMQQTASQVGGMAAGAADCVGKKAGALLSVAKLNIQIMDLKTEINARLREVGEMLYATHTGTFCESEVLLNKLQEIDALKASVGEMEAEIARLQQLPVCPICGAPIRIGDVFCRECGGKLS